MSSQRKRILIVDDDVSLGEVLQQALKPPRYPYEVRLARDADQALAKVSRQRFDLIITDIKMEGLSGLQLLEALRQVAPDVPTIAMTAFGSGDIEERARTLGVCAYLTKPFTIQEFRQCVNEALETETPARPAKQPSFQLEPVNEALAELRTNTGTHSVFFIEERTTNILGVASDANTLDLTSLAKILVDITHRMTAEVARVFGGSSGFQRIQYVGESFNLSTYRLDREGFLILVYDHQVKEGIISFYARQTLEKLAQVLENKAEIVAQKPGQSGREQSPETSNAEAPPRFETEESSSEPISLEEARALGLLNDDFLNILDNDE
jgi:DNA-binding response OmpR family regulator